MDEDDGVIQWARVLGRLMKVVCQLQSLYALTTGEASPLHVRRIAHICCASCEHWRAMSVERCFLLDPTGKKGVAYLADLRRKSSLLSQRLKSIHAIA